MAVMTPDPFYHLGSLTDFSWFKPWGPPPFPFKGLLVGYTWKFHQLAWMCCWVLMGTQKAYIGSRIKKKKIVGQSDIIQFSSYRWLKNGLQVYFDVFGRCWPNDGEYFFIKTFEWIMNFLYQLSLLKSDKRFGSYSNIQPLKINKIWHNKYSIMYLKSLKMSTLQGLNRP